MKSLVLEHLNHTLHWNIYKVYNVKWLMNLRISWKKWKSTVRWRTWKFIAPQAILIQHDDYDLVEFLKLMEHTLVIGQGQALKAAPEVSWNSIIMVTERIRAFILTLPAA